MVEWAVRLDSQIWSTIKKFLLNIHRLQFICFLLLLSNIIYIFKNKRSFSNSERIQLYLYSPYIFFYIFLRYFIWYYRIISCKVLNLGYFYIFLLIAKYFSLNMLINMVFSAITYLYDKAQIAIIKAKLKSSTRYHDFILIALIFNFKYSKISIFIWAVIFAIFM